MGDEPEEPKLVGIEVTDSTGTISGGRFAGLDVGVKIRNSATTARNLSFDGIKLPYDVASSQPFGAEGSRITNDPKLLDSSVARTVSGWGRNGPPLPAQCPRCKTVFASKNYEVGTPRFYSRDNDETCPKPDCHYEHAKVADGLFDLTEEAVRILSGSNLTHAMVAALTATANAGVEEKLSSEQVISQFTEVSPELGEVARKTSNRGRTALKWFCAAIGFIIPTMYAHLSYMQGAEANKIAKEALDLQKKQASSDELMKEIAQHLSDMKFMMQEQLDHNKPKATQEPSAAPADSKSPAETGSIKLAPKCKPKSRHTKRRAKADRRRAFSPTHPGSSCD